MSDRTPPIAVEAENGGFFVQYGTTALYSRRDPRSAPERAASELNVQPETLYLVPSPLLGYGLQTLLKRIPDSSAVLALEADLFLAQFSAARLPPALFSDRRFRFLAAPSEAARAVHTLGRFRRCVEIPLSFGRKLHVEEYDAALADVDAELSRYWRNRMTMIHMGRLWTRNIVRNLGGLPGADLREPASWGSPIVVCGAGPSLDAVSPWIASMIGRVRILACDTAVGPLLARRLVPDAIVCLEGQVHNLKDFLPVGPLEIPIFADLTAHPSAFHAVRGPKILTLSRFEELGFLDRLEALSLPCLPLPALASVGVLAVHLARALTAGPIFLAGLDFSFKPGATHAKGAPALNLELQTESRLYKARRQWKAAYSEDSTVLPDGERTGAVLSSYADLLSQMIRGDGRVFDIRPGGLPLGTCRASFREASRIVDAAPRQPPGPAPLGPALSRASLRARSSAFLSGEQGRLEDLLASLQSADSSLSLRVSDCDWIYSWFPDEGRVRGLSGDVRNRLLAEALDWKRRLNQALAALEEG